MYSLKRVCDKLLGGISKKMLVILLALTVTMVTAAGGTLAFLYGTQGVKNTFTYTHGPGAPTLNLEMVESDSFWDSDGNGNTNEYPMLPGQPIHKDPKVTVGAGTMDCWLFVELTESWNFADYLSYTVADGWEPLEGVPGVFCRAVDAMAESQIFPVIKDDLIHMKESVTLGQLATLTDADYPTLTIKAYAIQRSADIEETATAQAAWALLQTVQ